MSGIAVLSVFFNARRRHPDLARNIINHLRRYKRQCVVRPSLMTKGADVQSKTQFVLVASMSVRYLNVLFPQGIEILELIVSDRLRHGCELESLRVRQKYLAWHGRYCCFCCFSCSSFRRFIYLYKVRRQMPLIFRICDTGYFCESYRVMACSMVSLLTFG